MIGSFVCVDCGCGVYQFPPAEGRALCVICAFIDGLPAPERGRVRGRLRVERARLRAERKQEAEDRHAQNPR